MTGTRISEETITYQSVDAYNRSITLSAKLYFQRRFAQSRLETIDFVVLNCHPTITHNAGAPTGSTPQMDAIKYMCSENALVICPDYIGFGETDKVVHPYMCSTLTARNVLDCYKAAIAFALNDKKATFSNNYYTINVGYSQGGATALAFQKYLETEASDADRDLVKLRGSICGAGPYSQNLVFDEYEEWCKDPNYKLDYPIYLMYVLKGHKEAFGATTMRDLELKDCFTKEFWDYCEAGFMKRFDEKGTNVDNLNAELKVNGFDTFYSIINADYANRNSKLYRTIEKTLAQSNLLADDNWTPQAELTFFHSMEDIVVPPLESQKAMERFSSVNPRFIDAIVNYSVSKNDLWQDAVFGEGIIGGIAGALGNTAYDFDNHDHRNCGARFYAMFLAGNLRPVTTTTISRAPSSVAIATPVNNQTLDLNANATVAAGYDDVTLKFTNDLPLEKMSFVSFPVKVDGFWFGYDAPRYKVTLNDDGEVTVYTPMGNLDDFEPGELYLVEPKSHVNNVLAREAGVTLKTKEYLPEWIMLNHRPLTTVGEQSYATAYMPFAYKSDVAYTIADSSEGRVSATKVGDVVPAGNGVLLVAEKDVASCYLAPVVFEPSKLDNNILLGTYKGTPNDSYLTFGRNKADTSKVGFYKYTGSTIKPYSCYLESTNSASSRQIDFAEPTGIESIVESVVTEVYSLDGKRQRTLTNGVNLVRSSNGMVKKVIK